MPAANRSPAFWIGTYARNGGRGLHPARLGPAGSLHIGRPDPRIADASYGVWDEDLQVAWFVHEREHGEVSAWHWWQSRWYPLGRADSGGSAPCHLARSPDGRTLAVANYASGSLGVVACDPETGAITGLVDTWRDVGKGPDPKRQQGPHMHCAAFAPDRADTLFAVDLGTDTVLRFDLQPDSSPPGSPGPQALALRQRAYRTLPGAGPRHLVFHPDGHHALLLCELAASLVLLRREADGTLHALDRVPTAQSAATENHGGHISLEGDRILVTNRGADTLAVFELAGSRLVPAGHAPTGGASPRQFAHERNLAVVANENDGTVSVLALADAGGGPRILSTTPVPGAAFVLAPAGALAGLTSPFTDTAA